ncbi:MAG: tRNA-dihydrouridine synthase C [Firmicutes bacterium ADurb.Bin356]|nr:MAG: tRNA-dihydrouridine synthase C [Firmicutes bacterium ADurb.Bin356]
MQLGALKFDFPVMLSPMAGITDAPFRLLCKTMGCDFTFTEMISAKGLYYGNAATNCLLKTYKAEHPFGVQLFGSDPNVLAQMAKRLEKAYPDDLAVIDINMGCPAPKIVNNGEGSALMKNMPLAAKIIERVSSAIRLPLTVKFRKGWDDANINAIHFARMAQDCGAAAVTVHGRTRSQGYSGIADWDIIGEVKALLSIPVFGNGDVYCALDALRLKAKTSCDGVLVARGAQGNPWIFSEIKAALNGNTIAAPSTGERIKTAITHARLQHQYMGEAGILQMRKHIAWYVKGLAGAAALRNSVNSCTTLYELEALLNEYQKALEARL